MARPICLRLLAQEVRLAASRTFCTAGSTSTMRTPMMAMTTRSSTSVKPIRKRNKVVLFMSRFSYGIRKPKKFANLSWCFAGLQQAAQHWNSFLLCLRLLRTLWLVLLHISSGHVSQTLRAYFTDLAGAGIYHVQHAILAFGFMDNRVRPLLRLASARHRDHVGFLVPGGEEVLVFCLAVLYGPTLELLDVSGGNLLMGLGK